MSKCVARKLIESHLVEGAPEPGTEIGLRIDQTLTQDATGTTVMLELEAMGLDRARTELSAQYVDHNLVQHDFKNADDHLYLLSACQRYGIWYSKPGNGVSHPVHQEAFGVPGKTLLGSDSHTPAAGAIGMLAVGAGGLEVALALAGEPLRLRMPRIWGVELTGRLPDWVSAKDVILEMLRRHGVRAGRGYVFEYYGPGLESLSVMDRHVIANMGTELGATSTVFPSDRAVLRFLTQRGRAEQWVEILPDVDAHYDQREQIDLAQLEPLIAMPSSPGNVRPVREVAGEPIYQAYVGSSANPGYRDFAVVAEIVKGRQTHPRVSLDINPSSRSILQSLVRDGHVSSLIAAGARLHQAGCNGCIGMGQAPATGHISLRTVPRNYPGRSGTSEDAVCLVSPETAAASALSGVVTDPRTLEMPYPSVREPHEMTVDHAMFVPPLPPERARRIEFVRGPNIRGLPKFEALPDSLQLPVALKVGNDVSTDEIMPAGLDVLPFRSNLLKLSEFVFRRLAPEYGERARQASSSNGGHLIVAGDNYGQGSSREHAALAPRFLGLRAVIAKSYARIHWQNLINFGVLPLELLDPRDYDLIEPGDLLELEGLGDGLVAGAVLPVRDRRARRSFDTRLGCSARQAAVLRQGGLINLMRQRLRTVDPNG